MKYQPLFFLFRPLETLWGLYINEYIPPQSFFDTNYFQLLLGLRSFQNQVCKSQLTNEFFVRISTLEKKVQIKRILKKLYCARLVVRELCKWGTACTRNYSKSSFREFKIVRTFLIGIIIKTILQIRGISKWTILQTSYKLQIS